MDDDMEDEIIYELFTAHAHIIWRYLGVTTAGLAEMIIPGPGETFKTKLLQPWPFMFFMFMILVASVVLQSSSNIVRRFMVKAHYALGLDTVGSGGFKSLGDLNLVTTLGNDNVSWDFHEGIAGIYGMQGRRGNMEDRYRVIQDVDVGDKKMSFFGVFDGHGGQMHSLSEFGYLANGPQYVKAQDEDGVVIYGLHKFSFFPDKFLASLEE